MKAVIDKERCKQCGLCISNCSKGALSMGQEINKTGYKYVQIENEVCIGCGICYLVCPDGVFSIIEKQEVNAHG